MISWNITLISLTHQSELWERPIILVAQGKPSNIYAFTVKIGWYIGLLVDGLSDFEVVSREHRLGHAHHCESSDK